MVVKYLAKIPQIYKFLGVGLTQSSHVDYSLSQLNKFVMYINVMQINCNTAGSNLDILPEYGETNRYV